MRSVDIRTVGVRVVHAVPLSGALRSVDYALVVETFDLSARAYAPVGAVGVLALSPLIASKVQRVRENAFRALVDVNTGLAVRGQLIARFADALCSLAEIQAKHFVGTAAERALAWHAGRRTWFAHALIDRLAFVIGVQLLTKVALADRLDDCFKLCGNASSRLSAATLVNAARILLALLVLRKQEVLLADTFRLVLHRYAVLRLLVTRIARFAGIGQFAPFLVGVSGIAKCTFAMETAESVLAFGTRTACLFELAVAVNALNAFVDVHARAFCYILAPLGLPVALPTVTCE